MLLILSIVSWSIFYYKDKEKRNLRNYTFSIIYTSSFMGMGYFLGFVVIPFFRISIGGILFYGVLIPIIGFVPKSGDGGEF